MDETQPGGAHGPPIAQGALRLAATVVEDYLVLWVFLALVAGLSFPSLAALAPLSTPILAVMVGSISLTLAPERFARVRGRALLVVLAVGATMPVAAFAVARGLGAPPAITAGFVVLGAVTPELVTPVMTELGDGDTALATAALLVAGLGSVAFVPAVVALLLGSAVAVDAAAVVRQLAVAVVLPMSAAVTARWRWPDRVGRYDDLYPSLSALMVVLVVGVVAAVNATLLRSAGRLLALVLVGVVVLNAYGYLAGWLAGQSFSPPERVAATLSVGMRDFAVAAALLVAAGFPPAATLPAVVFGVVEMTTSAGLARRFRRS